MNDCSETVAALRLVNWLSPSFPSGAFGYSHGLEAAVQTGVVTDSDDLSDWLRALVQDGSPKADSILCSLAYRAQLAGRGIDELGQLARALAVSRERYRETVHQGKAFVDGVSAWAAKRTKEDHKDLPYPVAFGQYAALHNIDHRLVITGYLNGFVSNLIQVAIRLSIIGQTQGLVILASLEAEILSTSDAAIIATQHHLGSSSICSDLMTLRHEALDARLFLS